MADMLAPSVARGARVARFGTVVLEAVIFDVCSRNGRVEPAIEDDRVESIVLNPSP
ncbi:hypothetical protein [Burkholderia sp. ABCPW 14]|uniref:hypothetical protein n=1 Tax=Burkholderia sp. ABCPW 14 TaxID=1637860 RepID=UPI0012E3429F|nr:hypothetical protein [Burkholderia sp. ABCPW 14]